MPILIIELTCPVTSSKFRGASFGKKTSDAMIDSRLFSLLTPDTNGDESRWFNFYEFIYFSLFKAVLFFSPFLSHCSRLWSLSIQYVQINTWNETSDSLLFFHHLFDHRWRQLRSFLLTIVSGHDEENEGIILSPSRRLTDEQQESDFFPSFHARHESTSASGPIALGQLIV